ncbi:MAG: ATP-binding cassette domain-containing protein [Planctomycetota bacterium]|nr:MAG: ATP-binding cassette domain-containing protein [Planctomycetota bacterium]
MDPRDGERNEAAEPVARSERDLAEGAASASPASREADEDRFLPDEGSAGAGVPTARLLEAGVLDEAGVPEPAAKGGGSPAKDAEASAKGEDLSPASAPAPDELAILTGGQHRPAVEEEPRAPRPEGPLVVAEALRLRGSTARDAALTFSLAGGVSCLLAPPGAGKTALVRTLLGLERPRAGSVRVLGIDPQRRPLAVRARVGYVPERPAFFPGATPDALNRFYAGVYRRWRRVRFLELLARFGVPRRRRADDLPLGVRARLALAVALAHAPRLLLVDVPGDLEPLGRAELLEALRLERRGSACLFATDRPDEAVAFAERVLVLDAAGRARFWGKAEELRGEAESADKAYRILLDEAIPNRRRGSHDPEGR